MFNIFKRQPPPPPPKPTFEIICPYCMTKNISHEELAQCKKCSLELPVLYRQVSYRTPILPPFFLQVAGHPQTGKTVWLMSLTHMLMKMERIWPGFFWQAATDTTNKFIADIKEFQRTGVLPVSTPMGEREAYLMLLNQMTVWAGRSLVIRDVAGESFVPMNWKTSSMPYFLHVPTTLLFFSLNDMDETRDTMDTLLTNYLNTLLTNQIDLHKERRNIVVVLSKADAIADLPNHLHDYLRNDQLWSELSHKGMPRPLDAERMTAYMQILTRVSESIVDWLRFRGDTGVAGFLAMAKQNNIRVAFSLVSSLGGAPNANREIEAFMPYRVLDPFFWAMEFEKMR